MFYILLLLLSLLCIIVIVLSVIFDRLISIYKINTKNRPALVDLKNIIKVYFKWVGLAHGKDLYFIEYILYRIYMKYWVNIKNCNDLIQIFLHKRFFINNVKFTMLFIKRVIFAIELTTIIILFGSIFLPYNNHLEINHNNNNNTGCISYNTINEYFYVNNKSKMILLTPNDINNNIGDLFNYAITNHGYDDLFKSKGLKNEISLLFNNHTSIIRALNILAINIYSHVYINTSALNDFLFQLHDYTNIKKSEYPCICPIFIGLNSNEIHFHYDSINKSWIIMFYPKINYDNRWSNNKIVTSIITYENIKLNHLVRKLTNHIEHSKTLLIDYFILNDNKDLIKREMKLNLNETCCFVQCQKINNI